MKEKEKMQSKSSHAVAGFFIFVPSVVAKPSEMGGSPLVTLTGTNTARATMIRNTKELMGYAGWKGEKTVTDGASARVYDEILL